jgi:DNA-binding transcriptional MerR regulator
MRRRSHRVLIATYSSAQAARVSGLSLHMVNYLCRNELVVPSSNALRGRGRSRQYTFADIVLLKVVVRLLDQGISVLKCKKSLTALRRRNPDAQQLLSMQFLVTDGIEVFLQNAGVLEKIGTGQLSFAFVLDLLPIRAEISKKLERRMAV